MKLSRKNAAVIFFIIVAITASVSILLNKYQHDAFDDKEDTEQGISTYVSNITLNKFYDSYFYLYDNESADPQQLVSKFIQLVHELNIYRYFDLPKTSDREDLLANYFSPEDRAIVRNVESSANGAWPWLIDNYPNCQVSKGLFNLDRAFAQNNSCGSKDLIGLLKSQQDFTKYFENKESERELMVPIFKKDQAKNLNDFNVIAMDISRTTSMRCKELYPSNTHLHRNYTSILIKRCHTPRTLDILYTSSSLLKEFSSGYTSRVNFTNSEVFKLRRLSEVLELTVKEQGAWQEVRDIEDIYMDMLLTIPFFELPAATIKGATVASHLAKAAKASTLNSSVKIGTAATKKLVSATNRATSNASVNLVKVSKAIRPVGSIELTNKLTRKKIRIDLDKFFGKSKLLAKDVLSSPSEIVTKQSALAQNIFDSVAAYGADTDISSAIRANMPREFDLQDDLIKIFQKIELWEESEIRKYIAMNGKKTNFCPLGLVRVKGLASKNCEKVIFNSTQLSSVKLTDFVFSTTTKRYLKDNGSQVSATIVYHELNHVYGGFTIKPNFLTGLSHINEGFTQYIAEIVAGRNGIHVGSVYLKETELVREFEAALSRGQSSRKINFDGSAQKFIINTYFAGDSGLDNLSNLLQKGVPHGYSEKILDEIISLCQRGRIDDAIYLVRRLF